MAAGALAALFIACSGDSPQVNPTIQSLQNATPTATGLTTSEAPGVGPSIESVSSLVASAVGGRPLRPLFVHVPKDRDPISRLARALQAAVPTEPDDRLHVGDRGRFLSVSYDDGTNAKIKQVSRCLPKSEDDIGEPEIGWCKGEWALEKDTWWVEAVGLVRSTGLSHWWDEMPEFMVRIGNVSIPRAIEAGEPFTITLYSWGDVVGGDSINLSLISSDDRQVELGAFPTLDTFQGQVTVPDQTPGGRYWLLVSGEKFSELVAAVSVTPVRPTGQLVALESGPEKPSTDEPLKALGAGIEFIARHEIAVKVAWLRSPDTLVINANACHRDPKLTLLRQTDVDVTVKMAVGPDPYPNGGPECLEELIVQLERPLGDRTVTDAYTGRALSVTPVPNATLSAGRQKQADSPPPKVVPDAIRDAVSDAELQDLQAVAEQYGMTLQEAFDRYAWNDNFSRAVQRIREAAPESFAGAVIVDATNAWIAFKGTPPRAALDIVDNFANTHSSISVEVRTGQKLTEAELEEAITEVHDTLRKAPEVIDIITGFDPRINQVESTVLLKNTTPDSVVDDLQAIAEKRLIEETRPDILDSISISVTRSTSPVIFIAE